MDSRLDMSELKHACLLVNTADYCQTTALEVSARKQHKRNHTYLSREQLEEKVREKVNDEFKDRVTFQVERDQFVRYVRLAFTSLSMSDIEKIHQRNLFGYHRLVAGIGIRDRTSLQRDGTNCMAYAQPSERSIRICR